MAKGDTESRVIAVIGLGLVAAALLIAVAAVKASWALGPQLLFSWTLLLLRVTVSIGTGLFFIGLGAIMPLLVWQRWTNFAERHPEAKKAIARRTPTIAAVAVLLAEFSVSVFDAGAEVNKPIAVTFKALAALGFWLANDLFLKRRNDQIIGVVIWVLTIGFLLLGTLVMNKWTWRDLLHHLQQLDSTSALSLAFMATALVVVPFVLAFRNPELFEGK
jgi:hypothetical protein